jgi:8-hydroxy-5-deazaflavin:NADPH oxidoreductase
MRIGILGSGDVGRALGTGFVALGHDVKVGTREPSSDRITAWLAKAGPRASAGTFAEAAAFAELAVLATAWSGTESALKLAGPERLAGKIVVDATNPLDFSGGRPRLAVGHDDSAGEQVQRWLPGARVVKAFNTVGNAHMFRPQFPGGPPDMFIAGNDPPAKATVTGLLRDFGWSVIDLGDIEAARLLEPLALTWITHAMRTGTWAHAFKLLQK